MLRGSKAKRKATNTLLQGVFSNFCGPGGFSNALPQNELDAICKQHDEDYGAILAAGKNPYFHYNWADEKMVKAMKAKTKWTNKEAFVGRVADKLWEWKKSYLSDDPSLLKSPATGHKRGNDRDRYTTPLKSGKYNEIEISPDMTIRGRSSPPGRRQILQEDEDIDMDNDPTAPSASNPETAVALRTAGGITGRAGRHGETPVENIPVSLRNPWPDTIQFVHTYYTTFDQTIGANANSVQHASFRLNSVFDCRFDGTYTETEQPLATADGADGTNQTPTYRNYYINYYNYWTVVKSTYRIRQYVRPTAADIGTASENRDIEVISYVYHHGAQNPPKYETGSSTVAIPHQIRREHDGMYYYPIRYDPLSSGKSYFDTAHTASGEYKPGNIKHEVGEDELKQTWHKVSEVPPTKEMLTIMTQKSPWAIYGSDVLVRTEVTIEYTCQWKDLKTQFQYPTTTTANPTSANVPSQT